MKKGRIINSDAKLKEILKTAKTIAIVGLSPKLERDSNEVARYLQENGYKIIPVRPAQKEILGETAYKNLDEVKIPVDIVNVFRNSSQIMPHAHEAIRNGTKVFWMQLGIENAAATELLVNAGIDVIINRCTKVDHESFFKKNILV